MFPHNFWGDRWKRLLKNVLRRRGWEDEGMRGEVRKRERTNEDIPYYIPSCDGNSLQLLALIARVFHQLGWQIFQHYGSRVDEAKAEHCLFMNGGYGLYPVSLNCPGPGYLTHRLSGWIWSGRKDMAHIHLHFLSELRTKNNFVLIYTFPSHNRRRRQRYNNQDVVVVVKNKGGLILDSRCPLFFKFLYYILRRLRFCFIQSCIEAVGSKMD